MKKYLFALVALFLVAGIANAGMNLRQNRDGTADWVNSHSAASGVGAVYLTTLIPDVSTASTSMVVSPITDAFIDDVRLVLYGKLSSANAEILITVANPTTAPRRVSLRSPANTTLLLSATFHIPSTAVTGQSFSVSTIFMIETTGFSHEKTGANATRIFIEKGTVIYIATDGASTLVAPALVVITLRPRG